MRSRPFLLVAAAYALGIVAGAAVALPPRWLLGLGLVLALVAVSFGRFQTVTFWPLLVCAGAANFIVQTAVLSPLDLRACVGGEPRLVRLRGRLIEAPSLRIAPGPRGPTGPRAGAHRGARPRTARSRPGARSPPERPRRRARAAAG